MEKGRKRKDFSLKLKKWDKREKGVGNAPNIELSANNGGKAPMAKQWRRYSQRKDGRKHSKTENMCYLPSKER